MLGRRGDALLDVAAVGVTSLVFLLVWGRAVNSAWAYRLSRVPVLGNVLDSLRAATNQAYDVSGED